MAPIDLALAELEASDRPNINATAKVYGLSESTLRRRFRGQTQSRAEAASTKSKLLKTDQELVIIEHIKELTSRGMPPTSQMLRNLVEELVGHTIGKHWTGRFIKRYETHLIGTYLKGIEHVRKVSDNLAYYSQYFTIVSYLLSCLL